MPSGLAAAALGLLVAGIDPVGGSRAANGDPQAVRVSVHSHGVERVLRHGRDARALPVHGGSSVRVRANGRIDALRVSAGRRVLPTSRARGNWRFAVAPGDLPARVALRGRLGSKPFSVALRLREHDHRPVRTAPARTVEGREVIRITWVFRPRSVRELLSPAPRSFPHRPAAKAAVVARVVGVKAGPPISGDEEPGHEGLIETQRIHMRVESRWFGRLPRHVVLFKTGSADVWAAGDPLYVPGERYVLFLDRGIGRTYIPVAPDGRLAVRRGTLWPLIAGPVGRAFSGLTVEEAKSATLGAKP